MQIYDMGNLEIQIKTKLAKMEKLMLSRVYTNETTMCDMTLSVWKCHAFMRAHRKYTKDEGCVGIWLSSRWRLRKEACWPLMEVAGGKRKRGWEGGLIGK